MVRNKSEVKEENSIALSILLRTIRPRDPWRYSSTSACRKSSEMEFILRKKTLMDEIYYDFNFFSWKNVNIKYFICNLLNYVPGYLVDAKTWKSAFRFLYSGTRRDLVKCFLLNKIWSKSVLEHGFIATTEKLDTNKAKFSFIHEKHFSNFTW